MFIGVFAAISILGCIAGLIFDLPHFDRYLVGICASVVLIYFADLCRDVSAMRKDLHMLRRQLAPTEEELNPPDAQLHDGVNQPGPRYAAVLKVEQHKKK